MANGMFTDDAAAYFANPFRMQDAINQANLTALLKQKEAEVAQQRLGGMLLGGMEGPAPGLTQSQIDFLNEEAQTPGARAARMQQLQSYIPTALSLLGIPSFNWQKSLIGGLFGYNPQGMAVSPSALSDPTTAFSNVTDFSYDGSGGGVGPSETGSVSVDGVDVGYGGEYG